jgi:hypothetical protein
MCRAFLRYALIGDGQGKLGGRFVGLSTLFCGASMAKTFGFAGLTRSEVSEGPRDSGQSKQYWR